VTAAGTLAMLTVRPRVHAPRVGRASARSHAAAAQPRQLRAHARPLLAMLLTHRPHLSEVGARYDGAWLRIGRQAGRRCARETPASPPTLILVPPAPVAATHSVTDSGSGSPRVHTRMHGLARTHELDSACGPRASRHDGCRHPSSPASLQRTTLSLSWLPSSLSPPHALSTTCSLHRMPHSDGPESSACPHTVPTARFAWCLYRPQQRIRTHRRARTVIWSPSRQ